MDLSAAPENEQRSAVKLEGGCRLTGYRPKRAPELPLVSVITVTRNSAASLGGAMDAVLRQTYPNLEYIVIDGASRDATVNLLRQHDERIDYWVSETDRGLYDAMNKGVSLVSDPDAYVLFANADDRLHDAGVIQRLVEKGGGSDLVYGRIRYTGENADALQGREVKLANMAVEMICHPATMLRRRVVEELGGFDVRYHIAADYDLLVRAVAAGVSAKFVDEIVTEMRMGGESDERFLLSCRERKQVIREHFTGGTRLRGLLHVDLYDIPRGTVRRALQNAGLLKSWRAVRRRFT